MFFTSINVFILLNLLNGVHGYKSFCDRGNFDAIHTKGIYSEGGNTYSRIEIRIDEQLFSWDLKTNKISEPLVLSDIEVLVKIVIWELPVCQSKDNHCEELARLSKKSITFKRKISEYSYEIKKLGQSTDDPCNNCPLPWDMPSNGNPLTSEKKLWPDNWVDSKKPVAAYDPSSRQLVFVIDPRAHLENTKIITKSLISWSEKWSTVEMGGKYSFVGLITLLVVDGYGKTLRKNMNRVFGFSLRISSPHDVYEYSAGAGTFIRSDYTYTSLFQCPDTPQSNTILYIVIASVVGLVIVALLSILLIVYCCRRSGEPSTRFNTYSSSGSGGIGSNSSQSFTNFRKKSSNSK